MIIKVELEDKKELLKKLNNKFPNSEWYFEYDDFDNDIIIEYDEIEEVTNYYSYIFKNNEFILTHEF